MPKYLSDIVETTKVYTIRVTSLRSVGGLAMATVQGEKENKPITTIKHTQSIFGKEHSGL